jgi:hypothetical protein
MKELDDLVRIVLTWVLDESDEPHAHYAAQLEYDEERIRQAALAYLAALEGK